MTTMVNVWPAIGQSVPVPNQDSPPLSTSGMSVELTGYINGLLHSGRLLTYDPLDQENEPEIDYDTDAIYCTTLTTLVGDFGGQTVIASGYSSYADGGEGSFTWRADSSATPDGGTVFGTPANGLGRWHRAYSGRVDVAWFGTGVSTNTPAQTYTALAAAFNCGAKDFRMRGRTYTVTRTEATTMVTFTSQTGITIDGEGATIVDQTTYSAESLTIYFKFIGCTRVRVVNCNYTGQPLASPSNATTGVGYRGATWVVLYTGTEDAEVTGRLEHLRYGVYSGDYTTPSLGSCRRIRVNVTGNYCGYPVALYLCEDVELDITGYYTHRAAYLAGVNGVRGVVRFKNQYIAPIQVLLTEALEEKGTAPYDAHGAGTGAYSRGCSNVDIKTEDLGSTVLGGGSGGSWSVGLSTQRTLPMTFHSIKVSFNVKSTDAVATTLGGFVFDAGGTSNGYATKWLNTMVYSDIEFSGTVDRSAQTVSDHPTGDIYINTGEASPTTNRATVRSLRGRNVTITKGSFTPASPIALYNYGAASETVLENFYAPGYDVTFIGNPSYAVLYNGQRISVSGSSQNLPLPYLDVALSGASVTLTGSQGILPGTLASVESLVLTTITGTTGFLIGTAATPSLFANTNSITAGAQTNNANSLAGSFDSPLIFRAATSLVITSKAGPFTGGTLRLTLRYLDARATYP